MPVTTAVVGRQSIVDRNAEVVGYELLFRPFAMSNSAHLVTQGLAPISSDDMTVAMFSGALGVGINRLSGGKTVFINADRGILTGRIPIAFPPEMTVIEILESVDLDDEVIAGIKQLREGGFRLAADDFQWSDQAELLLPLVDIVKIDLLLVDPEDLAAIVARCRAYDVQLLAEKVETQQELDRCRTLGFDLFQGYFTGRPRTLSASSLSPSQVGLLRLASAVLRDTVTFNELEDILRVEPAITYKLLQLAAIGRLGETRRTVNSIRDALVLMGVDRLRGWVPALLMRPAGRAIDSRLLTVLTRARTVELLAAQTQVSEADGAGFAFTAGMLSGFDLLLGVPRQELQEALDIPERLRSCLFGPGRLATLIEAVAYAERYGTPDTFPGISREQFDEAAARSFAWAIAAIEAIDGPQAA